MLLEMERTHPYLLQTIHRLELAYFIVSTLNEAHGTKRKVCFTEGVEFSKKGQKVESFLPLKEKSPLSKLISNHNFGGAQCRAQLWVLQKAKKWKRKVVALTGLGLLFFAGLDDFQPFFLPVASATLDFNQSSLDKILDPPLEAEIRETKGK